MEKIELLIGKKVKAARIARNLSQSDLAKNAKTSLTTINRIENGKQLPHSGTLEEICKQLGLKVSELYIEDSAPRGSDRASLILDAQEKLKTMSEAELSDLVSGKKTPDNVETLISPEDEAKLKFIKKLPVEFLQALDKSWNEKVEREMRIAFDLPTKEDQELLKKRELNKQKG